MGVADEMRRHRISNRVAVVTDGPLVDRPTPSASNLIDIFARNFVVVRRPLNNYEVHRVSLTTLIITRFVPCRTRAEEQQRTRARTVKKSCRRLMARLSNARKLSGNTINCPRWRDAPRRRRWLSRCWQAGRKSSNLNICTRQHTYTNERWLRRNFFLSLNYDRSSLPCTVFSTLTERMISNCIVCKRMTFFFRATVTLK